MSLAPADYSKVLASLLPPAHEHYVLSLPVSPRKHLIPSHNICSLSVHPVLEANLHILNMDLPAAHFLLRHMQADPAWEAMYLHGILHRIEGDLDNARAWYGEVKTSEIFEWVWEGMDGKVPAETSGHGDQSALADKAFGPAMSFLDNVEAYKSSLLSSKASRRQSPPMGKVPDVDSLADVSLRELRRVLSFCERKYGTSVVTDASPVWVSMSEKHADMASQMITGGEGWREF